MGYCACRDEGKKQYLPPPMEEADLERMVKNAMEHVAKTPRRETAKKEDAHNVSTPGTRVDNVIFEHIEGARFLVWDRGKEEFEEQLFNDLRQFFIEHLDVQCNVKRKKA